MIIEYRQNDTKLINHSSRVLRTYKDVRSVTTTAGMTYLRSFAPAEINGDGVLVKHSEYYLVAVIHLAPGEYLERVDVPRD